jgi:hypothetical protein
VAPAEEFMKNIHSMPMGIQMGRPLKKQITGRVCTQEYIRELQSGRRRRGGSSESAGAQQR